MGEDKFLDVVRRVVAEYFNDHRDKTEPPITEKEVYIVWSVKVLQNNKALASTTIPDGMYYEITYNGDKKELYLDAYKKWENVVIPIIDTSKIGVNATTAKAVIVEASDEIKCTKGNYSSDCSYRG